MATPDTAPSVSGDSTSTEPLDVAPRSCATHTPSERSTTSSEGILIRRTQTHCINPPDQLRILIPPTRILPIGPARPTHTTTTSSVSTASNTKPTSSPALTAQTAPTPPSAITFRITLLISSLKATEQPANQVFYLYYDRELLTSVTTYAKFVRNIEEHRSWKRLRAEVGRDVAVTVGACSVHVGGEEVWFEKEGEFAEVMREVVRVKKGKEEGAVRCKVWVEDAWK